MLFISSEKLLYFSRYLSFCLDFSVIYQNGLIKKIRLTSNFMISHPGQQTVVIRIFPNILINKGNQTMKLGQLTECNMRNIFLKNYTQNMVEKLVQILFWKIKVDQISGSMAQSLIQFVYIALQVEAYQNMLKLSCRILAITSY